MPSATRTELGCLRYGVGTPPADVKAIIGLFNDRCSAMHLTNTDCGWLMAEDGFETDLDGLALWIESPSFQEWEPNFMSLTIEGEWP